MLSSSHCRLDTYRELLSWPIKKKTERRTDIPTSFPVSFYFFCAMGGILTRLSLALQLLVTLPVLTADARGLGGQGLGQCSGSAFAAGSLGVCLPPRTWVACVALGLAAKPVLAVETCTAWSICPRGVPPAPAGRAPPMDPHCAWVSGSWWPWASPVLDAVLLPPATSLLYQGQKWQNKRAV